MLGQEIFLIIFILAWESSYCFYINIEDPNIVWLIWVTLNVRWEKTLLWIYKYKMEEFDITFVICLKWGIFYQKFLLHTVPKPSGYTQTGKKYMEQESLKTPDFSSPTILLTVGYRYPLYLGTVWNWAIVTIGYA